MFMAENGTVADIFSQRSNSPPVVVVIGTILGYAGFAPEGSGM